MIGNLKGVPTFNNNLIVTHKNAITGDIIKTLLDCFPTAIEQTKEFAENFRGENTFKSANNIWSFVRSNITYVKDSDGLQVVQSPGALLSRLKGDCKSQSLLISSILHNLGADNVRLRFVSYNNSNTPTHVYTVFDYEGTTIPVDSVIKKFNYELPYKFKIDKKMNVYSLSGVYGTEQQKKLYKALQQTKRGTLCHNLIYKALQRERNIQPMPLVLTTDQYSYYKKRLKAHLNYHTKNNKLGLCYQLINKEYNDLLNNNIMDGIGSIGKLNIKKVTKGAKKIALVGPRNAFLLLVKENVFGLAGRLSFANVDKRAKFWDSFGGNNNKLNTAINQGKHKRAILGKKVFGKISGIGSDSNAAAAVTAATVTAAGGAAAANPASATTIGAVIAAAAPILAVVAKLLGNMKTAPKYNSNGDLVLDNDGKPETTTGSGFFDALKGTVGSDIVQKGLETASEIVNINEAKGDVETKPGVEIEDKEKGFKLSTPILLGGAGLLAILLLRKK